MRQLKLIFAIFLGIVLVSSCSSLPKTDPGLRKIKIDDDLTIAVFPDMNEVPSQGIDSIVKTFESSDMVLSIDYGAYSGRADSDDKTQKSEVRAFVVKGRPAKVAHLKGAGGDDFPYLSRISIRGIRKGEIHDGIQSNAGEKHLLMTVRCRSNRAEICRDRSEDLFRGIEIAP